MDDIWFDLILIVLGWRSNLNHLAVVVTRDDLDAKINSILRLRQLTRQLGYKITKIECDGVFDNADEIIIHTNIPFDLFEEYQAKYYRCWWNTILVESQTTIEIEDPE